MAGAILAIGAVGILWVADEFHDTLEAANFCFSEQRFITPEEKLKLAITDFIQQETLPIVTPNGRDLYRLARYQSVEEFLKDNPQAGLFKEIRPVFYKNGLHADQKIYESKIQLINAASAFYNALLGAQASASNESLANKDLGGTSTLYLRVNSDTFILKFSVKYYDEHNHIFSRPITVINHFDKCTKSGWRWSTVWEGGYLNQDSPVLPKE